MNVRADISISDCTINLQFDQNNHARKFEGQANKIVHNNLLPALLNALKDVEEYCSFHFENNESTIQIKKIALNLDDIFVNSSSLSPSHIDKLCKNITDKFSSELKQYFYKLRIERPSDLPLNIVPTNDPTISHAKINETMVDTNETSWLNLWPDIVDIHLEFFVARIYKLGLSTQFRKNLCTKFSDVLFYKILSCIVPKDTLYIKSIISNISLTQTGDPKGSVSKDNDSNRSLVKEFTLNYLLVDRGSKFNKKQYLLSLVKQMSSHRNMSYDNVIQFIYKSFKNNPKYSYLIEDMRDILGSEIEYSSDSVESPPNISAKESPLNLSLENWIIDCLKNNRMSLLAEAWPRLLKGHQKELRSAILTCLHLARVRHDLSNFISPEDQQNFLRLIAPCANTDIIRIMDILTDTCPLCISVKCDPSYFFIKLFEVVLQYFSLSNSSQFDREKFITTIILDVLPISDDTNHSEVLSDCSLILNALSGFFIGDKSSIVDALKLSFNQSLVDNGHRAQKSASIVESLLFSFNLFSCSKYTGRSWYSVLEEHCSFLLRFSPLKLQGIFSQFRVRSDCIDRLLDLLSQSDKMNLLRVYGSFAYNGSEQAKSYLSFIETHLPRMGLSSRSLNTFIHQTIRGDLVNLNDYPFASDNSLEETVNIDRVQAINSSFALLDKEFDKDLEGRMEHLLKNDLCSLRKLLGYDPQSRQSLIRLISKIPDDKLYKIIIVLEGQNYRRIEQYLDCVFNACLDIEPFPQLCVKHEKWFFVFYYLITVRGNLDPLEFIGYYIRFLLAETFKVINNKDKQRDILIHISHNIAKNMSVVATNTGIEALEVLRCLLDELSNRESCDTDKTQTFNESLNLIKSQLDISDGVIHKPKKLFSECTSSVSKVSIEYAGIVLISPYIPMLLKSLDLIVDNKFVDSKAVCKLIHLIHYLITGRTLLGVESISNPFFKFLDLMFCISDFPSWEDDLIQTLLVPDKGLTYSDMALCDSLLQSASDNWRGEGRMSINTMREEFLQREGVLQKVGDQWEINIIDKTFDMILSTIPWSYKMIKYPWAKSLIKVRWGKS